MGLSFAGMKAVIFDLDGVILSTDEFHYRAWSAIASKEGIPFNRETNDRLRGVSRIESLQIILEGAKRKYSKREMEALAEEKNSIYRRFLEKLSPNDVSSNVRYTLETLRSKGFKTAIGSSSKNVPLILERTAIGDLFDAVSDGNNISRSKPDPEVFVKAAEMLNVEPSACFAVDDSTSGLCAARRCGMVCCAIGPSCGSGLADVELKVLSDLIGCIKKQERSYV